MSLYEKLKALQVLDEAEQMWESYRSQITNYILEQIEPQTEIAIVGAGRCSDIDLKRLAGHFRRIVLLDKDEAAMQEAVKRYGVEKQTQIEKVEFIGLEDRDYELYSERLVQKVREEGAHTDIKALAALALEMLEALNKKIENTFLNSQLRPYENRVVLGVHSQLFSMLEWIWSVILQTIGKDEESVRAYIIEMNNIYMKLFNSQLISSTKQKLIIGCEAERIGRLGSIQGAVQALQDIKRRIAYDKLSCLDTKEIIWPFNAKENKAYLMKLYVLDCFDSVTIQY